MSEMQAVAPAVDEDQSRHVNEIRVRGRLSTEAERRELPSGDVVVTFRVIVDRLSPGASRGGQRQRVDTIDCAAWSPRVQRSAQAWCAGDLVEVSGALRRRFRRTAGGVTSRFEIEVSRARRVRTSTATRGTMPRTG